MFDNMDNIIDRQKHTKSVHNQQCIGPCYYSGTKVIHPLTLTEVVENNNSFCPVNAFIYVDPKTGERMLRYTDECYVPTTKGDSVFELLKEDIILPQFNYSSDFFIKIYYKINSFEELMSWLDTNNSSPYKTKERVFNNGMVVYGKNMSLVDHRFANFVKDIMYKNISKIYHSIKYNISIKDNKINISSYNTEKHDENMKQLIKKYIKEKFLGLDDVYEFTSKYIRYYKNNISEPNLSNTLVIHMIEYITKRINLTFNN